MMDLRIIVALLVTVQAAYADTAESISEKLASITSNVTEVNGIKIETTKTPDKTEITFFSSQDIPLIGVTRGGGENQTSISIFQKGTFESSVIVQDTNGDSIYDMIYYYVLDADGKMLRATEDFGMDGQADYRIDFENHTSQVYYDGQWRQVIKSDNSDSHIIVNEQTLNLRKVLGDLGRNF